MALITCKECGKQVSDSAKTCPGCGAAVPKKTSRVALVFAGLVLILMVKCSYDVATAPSAPPPPPKTPQQIEQEKISEAEFQRVLAGARQLKASMKNPDAFKLESAILMPDGSICYSYRGTNSFNATVPESFVIAKSGAGTSAELWNKYCAGKTGKSYSSVRAVL